MEVKRGEIYYVNFGISVGSEQSGIRPVLVIQNDIGNRFSPTVIGVPLTSKIKKELPTHMYIAKSDCPGLQYNSTALFEQITTFDKTRILGRVGSLGKKFNKEIYNKVLISTGLAN